jgi:hypothetical protein
MLVIPIRRWKNNRRSIEKYLRLECITRAKDSRLWVQSLKATCLIFPSVCLPKLHTVRYSGYLPIVTFAYQFFLVHPWMLASFSQSIRARCIASNVLQDITNGNGRSWILCVHKNNEIWNLKSLKSLVRLRGRLETWHCGLDSTGSGQGPMVGSCYHGSIAMSSIYTGGATVRSLRSLLVPEC